MSLDLAQPYLAFEYLSRMRYKLQVIVHRLVDVFLVGFAIYKTRRAKRRTPNAKGKNAVRLRLKTEG